MLVWRGEFRLDAHLAWQAVVLAGAIVWSIGAPASAQEPIPGEAQPPPPAWTGSFGAGLSLTRGNSDTSNINLSYAIKYDPTDHFVFASKGLWLRGSRDGELTASRLGLESRLDRKLGGRTSVFGQVQYARDLAPTWEEE